MKHKKRRPKGMLPKKRRMYQNGGGVGDPPQGTITPQEALMRALQPENQFRLTSGDAPFRTIREEQDRIAAETVDDSMFEVARFVPGIDVLIDSAELAKVAATGEDFYGEEQDPAMFAGLTAAGYLIPNILEKPLKSAWRAVKKFPAKLPKKEFRELPTESREAVLQNLTQAHREVYESQLGMTNITPEGEIYREVIPRNIRQLPSLMSGSKLENAVGKDGLIQVSQIENLIKSKDISAVEREALEEVMQTEAFQSLREMGGGSKVDYNKFRNLTSGQTSVHNDTYVEVSTMHANYGLDRLGYGQESSGPRVVTRPGVMQGLEISPSQLQEVITGEAETKLIKHNTTDLMSDDYGHFGGDVIGHYRTFERPDEEGVLYISELQSDPLQARGPAGQKTVGLYFSKPVDVDAQLETARIQLKAAEKHLAEVRAGAPYNPQKVYGAEGLPTGRASIDDPRAINRINKSEALGADDITLLIETDLEALTPMARAQREADFMAPTEQLISFMDEHKRYIQALEGGYRGGPNAKQAALIKNQDQFLISHILENEAKGADKLRFPTGETTSKIQGYGDQTRRISRAKSDVSLYENISKEARENELVEMTFKQHPMFKGKDEDEIVSILDGVVSSRQQGVSVSDAQMYSDYERGFRGLGEDTARRNLIFDWYDATKKLRAAREHLSRVNASNQATQGIMKGYDRLPKALKKHGLDATKVTDDVGNTWWEVDIPARLGEGVGEIRAYKKGGKFRILKK